MTGPLAGVRVLDFCHVTAGPFGTMILSDLGAEVIRVSRAEERAEVRVGGAPMLNDIPATAFSIQRGKKSIQLDLKDPRGVEIALRLTEHVDVLTENFSVGTMERLGLGYEAVSKRNPRIIYASCSGHGQTGPYASRGALDVIVQAMSGLMSITGESDGRPMRVGASFGDSMSGMYLAMSVLAALFEREQSGMGQRAEIAMVECVMYHLEEAITGYSITGEIPTRIGPGRPRTLPFQPFETKDGWIAVAGVRDWQAFCIVIGRELLAEDPRFQRGPDRFAHRDELEPVLMEAFREKTSEEWLDALADICVAGPVYNIAQAISDPQITTHGGILELPVRGQEERRVLTPNVPIHLSRTAPKVERAGPWMGEHTREVLQDLLGMSSEEFADHEAAGVVRAR